MAETVKKSRIVSEEDDLEESFMEEFNLRLKTCMSKSTEEADVEEEILETKTVENLYENVQQTTKITKVEIRQHYEVTKIQNGNSSSEDFIQIEKENYYEPLNNGHEKTENFYEEISEEVRSHKKSSIERNEVVPDLIQEVQKTTVEGAKNEFVTTEVVYENVRISLDAPKDEDVEESSASLKESESLDMDGVDLKSVKDRMFLSTDGASCLLFTQTVTSPMLTPSEENIDFLKGFRRESTNNTNSENSNSNSASKSESLPKKDESEVFDEPTSETSPNFEGENDTSDDKLETLDIIEVDLSQPDNLEFVSDTNIDEEISEPNQEIVNSDPASSFEFNQPSNEESKEVTNLDYENIEMVQTEQKEESIYENIPGAGENIYENIENLKDEKDKIYENVFDCKQLSNLELDAKLETEKFIEQEQYNIDKESNREVLSPIKPETTETVPSKNEELPIGEIKIEETSVERCPLAQEEEEVDEYLEEKNSYVNVIADIEETKVVEILQLKEESDVLEEPKTNGTSNVDDIERSLQDSKTGCTQTNGHRYKEDYISNIETVVNTEESFVPKLNGVHESNNKAKKPPKPIEALQKTFEQKSVTTKEEKEEKVKVTTSILEDSSWCKKEEKTIISPSKVKITPPSQNIESLKSVFTKSETKDTTMMVKSLEKHELTELKSLDIMKQINKFEKISPSNDDSSDVNTSTETSTETTYTETIETNSSTDKSLKKKKSKKSRTHEKENISVKNETKSEDCYYNVNVKNLCRSFGDLTKIDSEKYHNEKNRDEIKKKSSFSKFDALQKKNILHVRSSDSSKAQDKFNGTPVDTKNCKACDKQVFQMEQIKAEKAIWHKNCFRCKECNKQLTVDIYESHEGNLYCKPHFKSLFAPKVVEDEAPPSDKPDLGLEELQSLNVKERFQVFEQHEEQQNQMEKNPINVKRSPSILSKLARFQAKGMDIGVTDESLNGIPIEESSSEEEVEEEEIEGEDAELVRAKRVQKEKPFHFTGMSDVKNKWEQGESQQAKDERREERKQEIQSIRNRLFMGKQVKMKEMYQQAVMESESGANVKKSSPIEVTDTRTIKERFEKGEGLYEDHKQSTAENEDMSIFESGISKKSRSIFLELDANAAKQPQVVSPVTTPKITSDVKKAREVFMNRTASEDVVKSSEQVDDVTIRTADIQERFKFFETYKEPEQKKREFRITPPREGQVKETTPDREIYRDPDIVRAEEHVEDSIVAKERHTATKMLNKFRQMEENLSREQVPLGPKPLKRFTPPPEPTRAESESEGEYSETEEEEDDDDEQDELDHSKLTDEALIEAKKAARAKQLRAKFEKWEASEIKREQNNSSVNIAQEIGDDQSLESTRSLRARFESMKVTTTEVNKQPRAKVNRFVDTQKYTEFCQSCNNKVYPLEKITVHNIIFHKGCFKCKECNCILRMDSYAYNQGFLYCMPHFKRLFITKGNYDTAFGFEQHKEKWNFNTSVA